MRNTRSEHFTSGMPSTTDIARTSPEVRSVPMSAFCTAENCCKGCVLVAPGLRHHLSGMPVIEQLASDDVLDRAYEWLCRRRRDYSPHSDVWAFRRCWPGEKERIKGELLSGNYRFSLLSRCMLKDGEDTDLWSA